MEPNKRFIYGTKHAESITQVLLKMALESIKQPASSILNREAIETE